MKLFLQCLFMAIGIYLSLKVYGTNDGAAMWASGFMFGIGWHWYCKSLGLKSLVVGALMAITSVSLHYVIFNPSIIFWLIVFVSFGIACNMTIIDKPKLKR